jgi:ABC-type transport system involved in multi-copper enzyme maturation permease subunit
MSGSVVKALILTDWYRHRVFIFGTIAAGALALTLIQVGGELPTVFGAVLFFTGLIVLGCMLPVSNVINERKKKTLAFLMSLPISAAQFTTAKLISTFGLFLVPWITLVLAAFSFIVGRQDIPNGVFPPILAVSMLTFVGFALIASTALVTESEGATIAATIVTNTSYGMGWYMLVRNKAIREAMKSPTIFWPNEVLTVLGVEAAIIVVILAVTFYLQSRKRDFV